MTRRRRIVLVGAVLLGVFAAYEAVTSFLAYTGDAYVWSDLVAVAPGITGRVVAVRVTDNQTVKAGDPLLLIDPVPFQLAVADRAADVQAARTLIAGEADTAGAADSRQVHAMRVARLAQAEAALAVAQWRLAHASLLAPTDGIINNLTVRVGDTAIADQPLIGIVDAHAWRVVANYKQSYIPSFRPAETAWVWLDQIPWHVRRAHIAGIARAIGRQPEPAGLLPYVAPTTDWILLQRRFPVTLLLDDPAGADPHLLMGANARVLIFP